MKVTRPHSLIPRVKLSMILSIALLQTGSLSAQESDEAQAPTNDDDIITLSPFVVSGSGTGYQALTTLAGTRLNTPLKDLGASISIYTKDFIEDIGVTDSNDLLIYATGMEAGGAGGNFSAGTDNSGATDINAEQVIGESSRVDPQQSSRTRRLSRPNFSRNYFNTDIAFDPYNSDTVTVIRGPNAVLFGVGSPAGVVDHSLIQATLAKNRYNLSTRYGNNDSLRASADINLVLIDKKLAVRVATLYDKERYNQRPAFQEKKRVYGAVTYQLQRSTVLRANFESGNTRANRPITVLPFNSISDQWYDAGRPSLDWKFYDDPSLNPDAASQNVASFEGSLLGPHQLFSQIVTVYENPSDQAPAYGFRAWPAATNGTQANMIKNQLYHPIVNQDSAIDRIRFINTHNVWDLPANQYWIGDNVLPGQQPGYKPVGIKVQGFTDLASFDFKNRMIDETGAQNDSFRAFNISLEQLAWDDRIGIEVAYDEQFVDRRSKNSFLSHGNATHIRIDTNVTLDTGIPNPNVGRPYAVFGRSSWSVNVTDRTNMRATAFLRYDFRDLSPSWCKWLGRHRLTGLYTENAIEQIRYNPQLRVDGLAALHINSNISATTRLPVVLVYMGPSIIGNNNPLQLQPIQIPEIKAGPTIDTRHFVREAGATDPGHFIDSPTSWVDITPAGRGLREVIKSTAFALQSYWLDEHLITVFGWRRDKDYFAFESLRYTPNPDDPNDPGKADRSIKDLSFPNTPPLYDSADVETQSAVLRWPMGLIKLPEGMDISVFYNQSENFTPTGGAVDPFGNLRPSPRGKTKEYGFNLMSFNEKLTLRVNWFETSVKGQPLRVSGNSAPVNSAVLQTAQIWAQEGNFNPHLAASRNADVELLFSALPEGMRELIGWRVTGTAPNIVVDYTPEPIGILDTTDYSAKGTELELIYNPTRNWTILANVAKQETINTNSLPFYKDYLKRMESVWEQLSDRPRGNYPEGWQPGDSLVNVTLYGQYLDNRVRVPIASTLATEGSASAEQRKWRANLVTNYRFGPGSFLKGWSIGGGVRWQDRIGIGYPTSRLPDSTPVFDIDNPYYAPALTNVDAWVGYSRKILNGKVNWRLRLNVRNLYSSGDDLIPIGVQPWGEVSTVRLAPERRWYLTNSFDF